MITLWICYNQIYQPDMSNSQIVLTVWYGVWYPPLKFNYWDFPLQYNLALIWHINWDFVTVASIPWWLRHEWECLPIWTAGIAWGSSPVWWVRPILRHCQGVGCSSRLGTCSRHIFYLDGIKQQQQTCISYMNTSSFDQGSILSYRNAFSCMRH